MPAAPPCPHALHPGDTAHAGSWLKLDPGILWGPLPQRTLDTVPQPRATLTLLLGHALAACVPSAYLIAMEGKSACSSRGLLTLQADDLVRRPAAGRSRALARPTPRPPLQGDPDVYPSIPTTRCTGDPGMRFQPAGDMAQQARRAPAGCAHTGGGSCAGLVPSLHAAACNAAALRSSAAAAAAEAEAAAQAAVESVLARAWV